LKTPDVSGKTNYKTGGKKLLPNPHHARKACSGRREAAWVPQMTTAKSP
jgi:hypothetical protein